MVSVPYFKVWNTMHAKTSDTGGKTLTETEQKAIDIIETCGKGDRVLFNDRVKPLTVEVSRGPNEGRRGYDWVELEGPRDGIYQLVHRHGKSRSESVTLRRESGQNEDGFPTYEDMSLSSIDLVDHHEFRIGQVFEVTEPIVGDEYYHVVTDCSPSECYHVETVGIRVEDGDVAHTEEDGWFTHFSKERIFNGQLQQVDELAIGYTGGRGVHYDTERGEEVRLAGPHDRGVDLRPIEGHGLEVVKWDTILFGFGERFEEVAPEDRESR